MEVTLGSYSLLIDLPAHEIGMLAVLIGLTALAYWKMGRMRKERTLKLGNFDTLKKVNDRKSIASPSILFVKILTVTLLFLVATGSIQILHQEQVSDTDFVLAVDNTFSMETPDYEPTRMGMTKGKAENWVRSLPDNSDLAVISFSRGARPVTTPTSDKEQALQALRSIEPDLGSSGTSIGDGIHLGVEMLSDSEDKKEMVVVTDGENNAGMNLSKAIDRANNEKVSVNIIGISSTDRTEDLYKDLSRQLNLTEISTRIPSIDGQRLSEAAESTGGEFYRIEDSSRLAESLKQTSLKEERIELDSNYYISILIALIIITEILLYSRYGAI